MTTETGILHVFRKMHVMKSLADGCKMDADGMWNTIISMAKEAMRLASHKLPIKTRFVKKEAETVSEEV